MIHTCEKCGKNFVCDNKYEDLCELNQKCGCDLCYKGMDLCHTRYIMGKPRKRKGILIGTAVIQ